MTNTTACDILNELSLETADEQLKSWSKKRLKKFLTNVNEYDNLNKLFQTAKTKNLDNYTIDNNPENSKENYSEQTFNVEP